MQIRDLIALLYDTANAIDANFSTGTSYHLNQKLNNREDFLIEPPFLYLFRPLVKNEVRALPSAGFVSSYSLPFVYFHVSDAQDNSDKYEEAQAAGDDFIKAFINQLDENDLVGIDEIEGEGDVKYFDAYIVRKFTLTITVPDNFDYCSLDPDGFDYALNFGLN